MFRSLLTMLGVAILLATSMPASPVILAQGNAQLLTSDIVPNSDNIKFPSVDAAGTTVHVAANPEREFAAYWSKPDSAVTPPIFPNRTILGEANADGGRLDESTAAVTVAPNGDVYVAWATFESTRRNAIYLRRKPAGQDWEAETRQVLPASPYQVGVDIAVTTNNLVFVVWRDDDDGENKPLRYRISYDQGRSWTSATPTITNRAFGAPSIASGPDGQLIVAFASLEGQVVAASWNGSSFDLTQVSSGDFDPEPDGSGNFDPSVTIAPNGRAYIAWRTLSSNDIYYAERQSDGSWPNSRLIDGGNIFGSPVISADDQNNVNLYWIDRNNLFYTYKPAIGSWASPALQVPLSGASIFNVESDSNVSDRSYAHAVFERFGGSGVAVGYVLFTSNLVTPVPPEATPLLDNNARATRNNSVTLSFTNQQNNPTEVIWRWGAEPTAALNDSGGWRSISGLSPITIPNNLLSDACTTLTLFTKVRNANQLEQTGTSSDAITLDRTVQATARLANAGIGAPGYTSSRTVSLVVESPGECSDPLTIRTRGLTFNTSNDSFTSAVELPSTIQGTQSFTATIADNLGSVITPTLSIIYDTGAPTIRTPGTLTVTLNLSATILFDLKVQGTVVSDTTPLPWGADIAITQVPTTSQNLAWKTIQLPQFTPGISPTNSLNVSLPWSLASSVTLSQLVPVNGKYPIVVYMRFRDSAGNPTPTSISTSFELAALTQPRYYLPIVIR